jgi:hypothetical protein
LQFSLYPTGDSAHIPRARNILAHQDPEQVTEDEASRVVDDPYAVKFSPRKLAALALTE